MSITSVRGAMTSELGHKRFAEMVLPHLDDAYGLARWLTGNRTDAEDVVQDACMKALTAIDLAVIERPRAWMLTIVRNTAFTWLAKNRPKSVLLTDDAQLLETAGAKEPGASGSESGGILDRCRRRSGAGFGDPGAAASVQGSHRDA